MTDAAPTHTDLKSTLEDLRASVDAEGTSKGLAGMMQNAFLKLLEVVMAMLMDFRAGKLAPLVTMADDDAGEAGVTRAAAIAGEPAGSRSDSGRRGWWWPASWFQRHDWVPASAGMTVEGVTFDEMTGEAVAFAGMSVKAVTFAGMTRRIGDYPNSSDGSAQSGCNALCENDEMPGIGGHAALPPLEGSSARYDGSRHARRSEPFVPKPMLPRKNSDQLRASLRPRRCRMLARGITKALRGQWRDGACLRGAFFEQTRLGARGLADDIVPS
jgi:hypothetical protein